MPINVKIQKKSFEHNGNSVMDRFTPDLEYLFGSRGFLCAILNKHSQAKWEWELAFRIKK